MFVTQAHSFSQQARLAITLAWVAGYTNIITFLACGQVTSHVSGTVSNFGRDVADGAWSLAMLAMFLLVSFFVGALIAGLSSEWSRRRGWESIYVLPIAIEALLLASVASVLEFETTGGPASMWAVAGIASCAMGVQNATITRISSGVVRTTHLTGVLTDLGLEAAQFWSWLREFNAEPSKRSGISIWRGVAGHAGVRRLVLLLSIIGSFAVGAGLGTLIFERFPRPAMIPPVLFLLWLIYQDIRRPIAEIEPDELETVGENLHLPESLAVYRLRKDRRRRGVTQRLPDLLAWADQLPDQARVVILDLGDVHVLDADSAGELRAAVTRLSYQHRTLIISGVTFDQVTQLHRAGGGERLAAQSVCSDLDLAIARGFNILNAEG